MMKRTYAPLAISLLLPLGCVASEDSGDDNAATDTQPADTEADDGPACTPGMQMSCVCTDGSSGMQACNAAGTAFGACECGGGNDDTDTGPVATDDGTDAPTSITDSGDTSAGDSTGGSESGEPGCVGGEIMACDSNRGRGYAECMADAGEFGACNPCGGTHPLVRGDLRYCEEGACYCGNLRIDPPVDACYGEAIADACCAYDLECY